MLHKAGKPNNLVESYGLFSLSSCLGNIVEKAVGDNLRKSSRQKMRLKKTGAQMITFQTVSNN